MELFYCPELNEDSRAVRLSHRESHHLQRVFRKRSGAEIALTNGRGLRATAIVEPGKGEVSCQIRQVEKIPVSPGAIRVALPTIRPNRLDWAVEKLSELGVQKIQLLRTDFTTVHTFKSAHLHKVAISALKQSKQVYLPEIAPPLPFPDWLAQLSPDPQIPRLLADLSPRAGSFRDFFSAAPAGFWIAVGPEGGFSAEEARLSEQHQFQPLKLAPQILRAETAAVAAAAQAKLYFL